MLPKWYQDLSVVLVLNTNSVRPIHMYTTTHNANQICERASQIFPQIATVHWTTVPEDLSRFIPRNITSVDQLGTPLLKRKKKNKKRKFQRTVDCSSKAINEGIEERRKCLLYLWDMCM